LILKESGLLMNNTPYIEAGRRFESGTFRRVDDRRRLLISLAETVRRREADIFAALESDLAKSPYEADITEITPLLAEIRYTLRHINVWAKPKRSFGSLLQFPSKYSVYSVPLGRFLIISPWNYPFLLSLSPLVGAIAAGNSAVVKPSELAPASAEVIRLILEESGAAIPVLGGAETAEALLSFRWDHIFYTGGARVGRLVMSAAARHLTPVTLELGGKSPVICEKDADIKTAAKRIAWGKLLNAGQTCVAPDYLFVSSAIYADFLSELKAAFTKFLDSENYPKIVNREHFDRLLAALSESEILFGGSFDSEKLKIYPALVKTNPDSPLMANEIFGPILPIFTYEDISAPLEFIKAGACPLALYLFSKDKRLAKKICEEISFGGGCINDTIIHIAHPAFPFGGAGESGIGAYHGREGFERFSRRKTVLDRSLPIDFPFRFPPYRASFHRLIKAFRRFL
jgi:aldehyde dehydrogenase (NAD+)